MKPNEIFLKQPKHFWAYVRTISENIGYTERGTGQVKIPNLVQIKELFEELNLSFEHLENAKGELTEFGRKLTEYFVYRAKVLNDHVKPRLMDAKRDKSEFDRLKASLNPSCPLPMNKQKNEKKTPAYFTGIINMLIESNCEGLPCDYDPRILTTVTRDNAPLRTLARRIDGAFTSPVNPVAVWEVKEYYYTTTFGSRIADGVYESLLDGMELEEMRESEKIHIRHYLMVDAYETWWEMGRSYLCRMVDMIHMNYVDEILFGHEVVEELPRIVKEWVAIVKGKNKSFGV